jgi:hypothetical protein
VFEFAEERAEKGGESEGFRVEKGVKGGLGEGLRKGFGTERNSSTELDWKMDGEGSKGRGRRTCSLIFRLTSRPSALT